MLPKSDSTELFLQIVCLCHHLDACRREKAFCGLELKELRQSELCVSLHSKKPNSEVKSFARSILAVRAPLFFSAELLLWYLAKSSVVVAGILNTRRTSKK
jgi:hypothetical protein